MYPEDEDNYTIFLQNIPTRCPPSVLEQAEQDLRARHINFGTQQHLNEMTIRKRLVNMFMQFGQIKKITTPLGQAGQLRGIAFI